MAAVLKNAARERLDRGELALGVILRQARTVDIAPIMQSCGYDWLFLDLEHNSMDLDTAVQIAVAALGAGIAPVARVPARQLWMATRILDGGGLGIVVPHVDTAAQAKRIADAFHYPPAGTRSWGGSAALYSYQTPEVGEAQHAINNEILTTVMIESPEAVRNAAEIAAVPGIDVLLFGSFDLTTELGIPGQMGHQKLIDAYQTVGDACRAHGKILGMGGINDNDDAARFIRMGCRYVLTGADHGFVIAGASAKANFMKAQVN